MRPQLLKVTSGPVHSFTVRQDLLPNIDKLHYHQEIELIQIVKGKGTQFIGDSIKRFEAGDIFLIGSGLPHNLKYDEPYVQESGKSLTESRVIQFHENFWGESFLNLPENKIIRDLLEQSKRGIQIQGIAKIKIASFLDKLVDAEGPERILLLLTILQTLAKAPHDVCLLSSIGFNNEVKDFENHRMSLIYEYTLANFKKKIQLEEIAKIAHISPHSFCRYFKSRTKKTYSQFLLEVKVGQACKLLMENDLSIKELCYESGFNNFASFHKYFKIITGLSPLSYKKEFNQRKPAA
ncbi:helix-turn-helix domain-containing protein [Pedobacter sp. HX-22-1]|uniref:Helix-turn-helix domain-containing protein n=2 Tax=Pedobacter puniceum TaxID=2666136 RepID=A0A7K0FJY3_9SPHI|nr:helix-turn-helix domain-containing protein [Pedobacter puniceum]